jgi:hypothetical protein
VQVTEIGSKRGAARNGSRPSGAEASASLSFSRDGGRLRWKSAMALWMGHPAAASPVKQRTVVRRGGGGAAHRPGVHLHASSVKQRTAGGEVEAEQHIGLESISAPGRRWEGAAPGRPTSISSLQATSSRAPSRLPASLQNRLFFITCVDCSCCVTLDDFPPHFVCTRRTLSVQGLVLH